MLEEVALSNKPVHSPPLICSLNKVSQRFSFKHLIACSYVNKKSNNRRNKHLKKKCKQQKVSRINTPYKIFMIVQQVLFKLFIGADVLMRHLTDIWHFN